jgi:hypothetical protein
VLRQLGILKSRDDNVPAKDLVQTRFGILQIILLGNQTGMRSRNTPLSLLELRTTTNPRFAPLADLRQDTLVVAHILVGELDEFVLP